MSDQPVLPKKGVVPGMASIYPPSSNVLNTTQRRINEDKASITRKYIPCTAWKDIVSRIQNLILKVAGGFWSYPCTTKAALHVHISTANKAGEYWTLFPQNDSINLPFTSI
ncbi:Uncharacterized protein Fot_37827 [Forsythia ovata]|uniref:Uncharacterized protein n=1 Tax=Forsythia ovata TaxID=205694 RepID=A0ABD1S044_9LAMI